MTISEFLSNNKVLIGVFVAIFIAYLLTRKKKRPSDFEKEYTEILDSDKYKVKNQYEKA